MDMITIKIATSRFINCRRSASEQFIRSVPQNRIYTGTVGFHVSRVHSRNGITLIKKARC
jgi:hypothetical protein